MIQNPSDTVNSSTKPKGEAVLNDVEISDVTAQRPTILNPKQSAAIQASEEVKTCIAELESSQTLKFSCSTGRACWERSKECYYSCNH